MHHVLLGLREAIAPARCIVCLKTDSWLCLPCWQEVTRSYPSTIPCVGCGEKATSRGLVCGRCRATTPLTGVISAGSYQLPHLQRGIRWLKFKGVRAVAPALARLVLPRLLLIGALDELQKGAVVIPIPLHPRRHRERGFNQSALLAEHISSDTGIPVAHALERQRATWAQSHLPPELRAENMQNSFVLASNHARLLPPSCRLVILVDDVTTSGSTLTAAAQALAPLHARQIWGLTVARG